MAMVPKSKNTFIPGFPGIPEPVPKLSGKGSEPPDTGSGTAARMEDFFRSAGRPGQGGRLNHSIGSVKTCPGFIPDRPSGRNYFTGIIRQNRTRIFFVYIKISTVGHSSAGEYRAEGLFVRSYRVFARVISLEKIEKKAK